MEFKVSFLNPFEEEPVLFGNVSLNEIVEIFKKNSWSDILEKMGRDDIDEIIVDYYSPTLEIENESIKKKLSISALADSENKVGFYIYYQRPKIQKRFFGLITKTNNNYATGGTPGLKEKDVIDCINAFTKHDHVFLTNKFGE